MWSQSRILLSCGRPAVAWSMVQSDSTFLVAFFCSCRGANLSALRARASQAKKNPGFYALPRKKGARVLRSQFQFSCMRRDKERDSRCPSHCSKKKESFFWGGGGRNHIYVRARERVRHASFALEIAPLFSLSDPPPSFFRNIVFFSPVALAAPPRHHTIHFA